ncbi:MAG: hypothetical protein ACR2HH_11165 [Chthoniobacterales bacterium]
MNDFSKLEAELKALRPAAPSAGLQARIEHSLGNSVPTAGVLPRRPKVRLNWLALGLGLAAAASVFFLARLKVEPVPNKQPAFAAKTRAFAPTATASARNLVPDGYTQVLYHRSDEGLVYPANTDVPVRRVRSYSRETLKWKDAHTGASLRVSYPTEEVELIPISVQ